MPTQRFSGRPVVVTGASSGLGYECARRFAAEGARVLLVARQADRLAQALAQLPGSGHHALAADAADEAAMAAGIKAFSSAAGPLRAGIFAAGAHILRPLDVCEAKHYEAQWRANVLTAAVAARWCVKHAARAGAALVFFSSVAARRGGPGASAYAAAKSGVSALARTLAVELAARGIRANTVVPGVVRTPMGEDFLGALSPARAQAVEQAYPLGFGQPADVAAAVCFLASDEARWITGTEMVLDGGCTACFPG